MTDQPKQHGLWPDAELTEDEARSLLDQIDRMTRPDPVADDERRERWGRIDRAFEALDASGRQRGA